MASQQVIASLQAILNNLVIGDNAARTRAEEELNNAVEENASSVLMGLAMLGTSADDSNLRGFSLLLLRRISIKQATPADSSTTTAVSAEPSSIIASIGNEPLGYIRQLLIQALHSEQDPTVRTRLSDCVSGLAGASIEERHLWKDLLSALVGMTRNPEARIRESAFRIYADTPGLVAEEDPKAVTEVFAAALNDPESMQVRTAAFQGSVAFLTDAETAVRSSSDALIGNMLAILPSLPTESVTLCLQAFMTFAQVYTQHIVPHFNTFIPFLLHLATLPVDPSSPEYLEISDESPAQPAIELLLLITESKPAKLRRWSNESGSFSQIMCRIALGLVRRVEVTESWGQEDEDQGDADGTWSVYGEESMDRLACALGGQSFLPPAWALIEPMLKSAEWQDRYAALMSIASIAEGTAKVMEAQLDRLMQVIAPLVADPQPRVRYGVAHAIGQLCTDFEGVIQMTHPREILTILLTLANDSVPLVVKHGGAALINFCDGVEDPDFLAPYIDEIFKTLLAMLKGGKPFVQEQAVTSLATLGAAADRTFGKYYGELMPLLLDFLRAPANAADPGADRLLRGKVLECCGLIGMAVGAEQFAPDASELARILLELQSTIVEDEDPIATYALQTWGKIAEVMHEHFAPYLPVVMPPLFKLASASPQITIDDDEVDTDERGPGWEAVDIGGQNVGINTSAIELTATAFGMLVVYSSRLGTSFAPYIEESMALALKNLAFFFDDDVRSACAMLIPILLSTSKTLGTITPQLLETIFNRLLEVSQDEPDVGMLAYFFKSFADSTRVIDVANLPAAFRAKFETNVQRHLTDMADKRKLRAERIQSWDEEEKEAAYDLEREEMSAINEASKALALFDPSGNHPLMFLASSVKDLGSAPSEDWEDDEDEE